MSLLCPSRSYSGARPRDPATRRFHADRPGDFITPPNPRVSQRGEGRGLRWQMRLLNATSGGLVKGVSRQIRQLNAPHARRSFFLPLERDVIFVALRQSKAPWRNRPSVKSRRHTSREPTLGRAEGRAVDLRQGRSTQVKSAVAGHTDEMTWQGNWNVSFVRPSIVAVDKDKTPESNGLLPTALLLPPSSTLGNRQRVRLLLLRLSSSAARSAVLHARRHGPSCGLGGKSGRCRRMRAERKGAQRAATEIPTRPPVGSTLPIQHPPLPPPALHSR
ncbi:hypothetical protein C8J57DRAFT_1237278 [Mycena rebaudengoi]|nr:hypothetical protein C8J57DRAFT_1237278 [Mycena rebaudengoi]